MYAIVVAAVFYFFGIRRIAIERRKDERSRDARKLLAAMLAVIMGVAITFYWLLIVFL